jgi:hypothetical protein
MEHYSHWMSDVTWMSWHGHRTEVLLIQSRNIPGQIPNLTLEEAKENHKLCKGQHNTFEIGNYTQWPVYTPIYTTI